MHTGSRHIVPFEFTTVLQTCQEVKCFISILHVREVVLGPFQCLAGSHRAH